jgi:hypothetical protein
MDAQGGKGSLKLRVSVQAVCGGAVTKKGKPVGIKAGWQAVGFQECSEVAKVAPGGVAGNEGAAEDFSGMVVEGQNEGGIMFGGPPTMRGRIMLPEFSDGGTLPAPTRFRAPL